MEFEQREHIAIKIEMSEEWKRGPFIVGYRMETSNVGTARGEFDLRCLREWDVINWSAFDYEYGNIMSTIEKHVGYELFCLLQPNASVRHQFRNCRF